MALLDGPRLPPAAGGQPRQLVVFLHGYGADGNDLIGLGRQWAHALPHAAFVSPHAPEPCGMAPMGRQWFNLTFRTPNERSRTQGLKGLPALEAFLDTELKRHGLGSRALALVGFSQGTMMALGVGLARKPAPAAIVGYSGALANLEMLPGEPSAAPAILLVHGDADTMIPVDAMFMAREALARAGLAVEWHVAEGIGHGIDPYGLQLGGAFLRRVFGDSQAVSGVG